MIGIDEVGRGCLAGPVTVSAALVSGRFREPANLPELRDSKTMTRLQREAWYEWIKEKGENAGIFISISSVMPKTVDRINIAKAANLAAWRSLNKLLAEQEGFLLETNLPSRKLAKTSIILDGGLFLKSRNFQNKGEFSFSAETIIGADKKFREVKIAAIMAKVTRDAYMRRVALKYPEFGFERHKGYGTKTHIDALYQNGAIEGFHRQTFIKKMKLTGLTHKGF